MQSMTGFGQASGVVGGAQVRVEIKTVNGRYLDLKLRLPRELSSLEPAVRRLLDSRLHRGRVEVFFNLAWTSADQLEIQEPLVRNYQSAAATAQSLGIPGELSVSTLLQLPGVLAPAEQDFSAPEQEAQLLEVVSAALEQVVETRSREGTALRADLVSRLDELERVIEQVEPEAGKVTDHYRAKLEARLQRLVEREGVSDPARLAQEVLYYAERADITEELTRLRAHLGRFREVLANASGSVGKNLDFLCQEMNREMNTIVSKSSLVDISALGVRGKVEIEKIREQVQNVE